MACHSAATFGPMTGSWLTQPGGAGTLDHLADALRAGADAALCASIFHYGHYTVAEAKAHLAAAGVAVRA